MSIFKGHAHIGIHTRDIENSKTFYTKNLSFSVTQEVKLEKPDGQVLKLAFLQLGDMVIELIESLGPSKVNTDPIGSINHIAIEVEGIYDIVEKLKRNNVFLETDELRVCPNIFNGIIIIFIKGPSGERIELVEYM